jgi:hypothetical protein
MTLRQPLLTIAVTAAVAIALPVSIAGRARTSQPQPASAQAAKPQPAKPPTAKPQTARPRTSEPAAQDGAKAHAITLPRESVEYEKSDLPGYELTAQQCSICHSPEYVAYAPPTSPRAYWQATVDKMVKVFGAPLPPDQIPPIVDYLTRTYGAEAPKPKP